MFITVSYGADCHEIVNVQCRVLSLTAHLKRKCQCRPEDCVDLLDESGTLMNLSQVESPGSELARKYLQERQHYILIRVVRGENSEPTCYESLLENLEEHHPELAGSPSRRRKKKREEKERQRKKKEGRGEEKRERETRTKEGEK
uniref:Chromosome 22 open reading frame 15 n=1 Tax=Pelodiscus sinensis TaxID=13735 RepID=K7FZ55_PELSI